MMARSGGTMRTGMAGMGFAFGMLAALFTWTAEARQASSQADLRKPFVGTWRLVSITGGVNAAARGNPTGLIIYDQHGYMAAQIQPERKRNTYTGTPTPEQLADRARGYTAYFGTYTIDERAGIVTHHRQGQLDSGPVDFVRTFEFTQGGNRLILTPVGGTNPPSQLTWQRVR
ncbi:MAG: lipocalin-like domain-containing protein [Acidimicrobiia bacterium]|nr:lipocalin-like domain-containing protein [Acidimicrobiia bacterium]